MTFGQALEALKLGNRVARKGWNGKGMYIYLQPVTLFQSRREAHIVMFTAQGKHQPGWLASQPDMLSEDWEIV